MATSTSPTALRCLELAAAAAPGMVERAVDLAVEGLQEAERRCTGTAQRQEIADAWLALSQRRGEWAQRYPGVLRAAMEAEPAPAEPAKAQGRGVPLALVDDDALVQSLESTRLTQLLAPRLEQPLAELNALMSTALGLATVQPERNPLRPEVFARALRTLMQPDAQPQWPALWTSHMAKPLATELETLYRRALELLENANLQAASYRVLPVASVPSGAMPLEQPRAAADNGMPASAGGSGDGGLPGGVTPMPGQHGSVAARAQAGPT
ncbi:MAG: DUF1631 family protein, partial [Comamonadaceae bacterium]